MMFSNYIVKGMLVPYPTELVQRLLNKHLRENPVCKHSDCSLIFPTRNVKSLIRKAGHGTNFVHHYAVMMSKKKQKSRAFSSRLKRPCTVALREALSGKFRYKVMLTVCKGFTNDLNLLEEGKKCLNRNSSA